MKNISREEKRITRYICLQLLYSTELSNQNNISAGSNRNKAILEDGSVIGWGEDIIDLLWDFMMRPIFSVQL